MTDKDKIKKLRTGIMCAIIHLFQTNPQEVIDTFSTEELELITEGTDGLQDVTLEGIYKDLLDLTKPDET